MNNKNKLTNATMQALQGQLGKEIDINEDEQNLFSFFMPKNTIQKGQFYIKLQKSIIYDIMSYAKLKS